MKLLSVIKENLNIPGKVIASLKLAKLIRPIKKAPTPEDARLKMIIAVQNNNLSVSEKIKLKKVLQKKTDHHILAAYSDK